MGYKLGGELGRPEGACLPCQLQQPLTGAHYLHFTDEGKVDQGSQVTCPRSHGPEAELGFGPSDHDVSGGQGS